MGESSKKHHFNPQHILENFLLDGKCRIYVLDKLNAQVFLSTPKDAGHENHFNSVNVGDHQVNLEPIFQDADSRQSTLIRKIIERQEIKSLTPPERMELAQLVVLQLLRVKIVRNNIREFPRILREAFGDLGVDYSIVPDIDDNTAKLQSFDMLNDCIKLMAPFVLEKQWALIAVPRGSWFWTSDNPICITNGFASGDSGLASQGSKVSWPIAKDLMLQFSCASISNKIEASDKEAAAYLRSEPTMTCAPEHVDRFNLNQVVNSTRFVYAPTDDFDTAKQFLESHPDAKMQGGLIQRTQLSDHPDSLDQTLVIRGASTAYEIPFETWEDCGTHLIVRVSEGSVEELSRAILDFPHSAIQINDRTRGGRCMREIKLSQNETDARTVTIRHSNPVLAAIMGQARGRR